MKRALRIGALAMVLILAVTFGALLLGVGSRGEVQSGSIQDAAFPKPASNESCRECHAEIYDQWWNSYHRLAWDDPQLQVEGIAIKEHPDCWNCHVPEPVFLSGFDRVPPARPDRRLEGVGCIACHYTPEGMAGSVTKSEPPCKPVRRSEIGDIALCYGCHNQHKTHDEWATSSFHPDTDCNDCHMPWTEGVAVKGQVPRKYRAHDWFGCHDLETLRKAFTLDAVIRDGRIVVTIRNDGAGHNFPTDARFHRADLHVDVIYPDRRVANLFEEKYKNPFRGEIGVNTQLKPGEEKIHRLKLDPGASGGTARVRLLYCLQPYPAPYPKGIGEELVGNRQVILRELEIEIP